MMSSECKEQKAVNRAYLRKVLWNVVLIHVARQGLPFRSNCVPAEKEWEAGAEVKSNFYQLLLLHAQDHLNILKVMCQKTHRYTDHHIQDELLKLLAQNHLRQIASDINEAGYFALQADDLTNSSNQEQVVVCIRWVDAQFQAHEDFIGLHHVADITSAKLLVY